MKAFPVQIHSVLKIRFKFRSQFWFFQQIRCLITLRVEGSFHVKSTNPSHLTHMDFADILSSQCTHQEMKILKILSSYHERFQNYDHLNYGPSSLENKLLQFMAFWNCSYSPSFNGKHLKFCIVTHFLEVFTSKNLFSKNFENYTCGGLLKLSNWQLQYFFSHFQWAIPS